MQLSSVVSSICRMPLEFKSRGDVSMLRLVAESGYLTNKALITVELLSAYFAKDPESIDAWLLQSLENRSSPSWYLLEPSAANAQGKWVVGFYPGQDREYFERGEDACAVFVKNRLIQLSEYANLAS
jgi:hypothetical protein